MKNIYLSIIIPHYNTPTFLMRMLDTIPNVEDIEVIVVDDKSTKDLEILETCKEKYANRNITFLTNTKEQKGAGVSRNIGLHAAKGKWVMFADADDIFIQDISELVNTLENENADIVYFPMTSKASDGNIGTRHIEFANFVRNFIEDRDRKNEIQLRYRYTSPCSKFIKKELIDENKIEFDETLCGNDVMFSCKTAYHAKNISAVDKEIYCIIENIGSLSASADANKNMVYSKVSIARYKYIKERLSKKDFAELDLAALGRIVITIRSFMPVKDKVQQLWMLLTSGLRIFPRKLFTRKFWKDRFNK